MPNIKLKSNDNEIFIVDIEIMKCSTAICRMVENLGLDDNDEEVPIPNVNAVIMKKIIEWATFHKGNQPTNEEEICQWDADFLQVDRNTLFKLILAANYLDIQGLMNVTCQTVANMIKSKTPEEIRQTFNIQNDFTKEEEEQIRLENAWCEDKN